MIISMANLTVKNLPDALYKKLKKQAHAHRRSVAGETTVILERALGTRAVPERELLSRAKQLREETPIYLTEEDRKSAVRKGRA